MTSAISCSCLYVECQHVVLSPSIQILMKPMKKQWLAVWIYRIVIVLQRMQGNEIDVVRVTCVH